MTSWPQAPLSRLVRQVHRPVSVSGLAEVPFAGVRWYAEGVYARDVKSAGSVKTKVLNRLHSNDITYNRMWATKAAFGVVPSSVDGCLVTLDFPIFVAEKNSLPGFLAILFKTRMFQTEASILAVGTTERRRLKEKDFLRITVPLPPIAEQRRIVDLISALDAQIEALRDERDAVREVLTCLRDDLLSPQNGWQAVALGDVLAIARGGSPRPIDAYFTEDPDGINWIKIGDVPPGGKYIDKTGQRIRSEGVRRSRSVVPGDFLLSNSMSFGRPYILRIAGCIHDGWLVLSDKNQIFDQDFLYNLLRSRAVQTQFEALASGSAVRNLNIELVKTVHVAMPAPRQQAEISALLNVQEDLVSALEDELDTAKALRCSVVSTLLERTISIPESYDALLEAE